MAKRDGFGHERPFEGESDDWITPKPIIDALWDALGNEFDLDPCASVTQPWRCARDAYTVEQDGLAQAWYGNVWCNPPYGAKTHIWIERLAKHGKGIALVFARVETSLWQDVIFPTASGYLFPRKRVAFHRPDGTKPKSTSGAPSALIAWGDDNRAALIECVENGTIPGAYMDVAFYTGSREYAATLEQLRIQESLC